jgi:hypothetical protein
MSTPDRKNLDATPNPQYIIPMPALEDYLTTDKIAETLGLSETRIRQLFAAGVIRGNRKFGRWLATPREVERVRKLDRPPGRPSKKSK